MIGIAARKRVVLFSNFDKKREIPHGIEVVSDIKRRKTFPRLFLDDDLLEYMPTYYGDAASAISGEDAFSGGYYLTQAVTLFFVDNLSLSRHRECAILNINKSASRGNKNKTLHVVCYKS